MEVVPAFARHSDLVAAPIVLKGDVQRLVNVAHPVTEELEAGSSLIVSSCIGGEYREVFGNRRHHARGRHTAVISQACGISRFTKCSEARLRG